MQKIILVSLTKTEKTKDGKNRIVIAHTFIDLFRCPMGKLFKLIHRAMDKKTKVIIQPFDLVSDSLLGEAESGEEVKHARF